MNTNTFTLNTKFQQVGSLLIPFTVTEHDPLHTHTVTWKRHFLLIERDSHQMQIKFHADVFSLEHNRAEYFHSMIQQLYSSPYWVSFDVRYTVVLLVLYLSTRLQYGSFLSSMVQTQSSGMSAASHNIILKQKYQRKLPCLVPSGAQYIACGGGAGVLGLSQGSHLPATSQNCKSKLDECDPQQESFKNR